MRIVTTPDDMSVVQIGGDGEIGTHLYQLECSKESCIWIKMQQTLSAGRRRCVAMMVPNSIVKCKK
jgi:hypothetical protein